MTLQNQWRPEVDGRCGVCGDAWNAKAPREHEPRGRFHMGTVTRTYNSGQRNTHYNI